MVSFVTSSKKPLIPLVDFSPLIYIIPFSSICEDKEKTDVPTETSSVEVETKFAN